MARVVAAASNLALARFLAIFSLLEEHQDTTLKLRLESILTFLVGERLPVLVCLDSQEPHIRVLWGTQFVTPSFVRPTPEGGKVLASARDIWLSQLPSSLVMLP